MIADTGRYQKQRDLIPGRLPFGVLRLLNTCRAAGF